jgi:lipid-A-disaccharide synthase
MTSRQRAARIFLVAGEHSGDALGGALAASLKERLGEGVVFAGVGAEHMAAQGIASIFPLADVAVMGPLAILKSLPRLVRRVHAVVDAAVAFRPDVVVIIDSPEFTHPIARRIRKRLPGVPIIDYVSPSVWAWRPGRAKRMRAYVDHVLALLPFEPEAHARLGGPPCTYVGHPMIERLDWLEALDPAPLRDRLGLEPERPVLVVLPGSRASEVTRLAGIFGRAVAHVAPPDRPVHVIVPTVPSVRPLVERAIAAWGFPVHVVEGEDDKFRAFKLARAALAASGTVTLQLALAGTPMVVAYRVDAVAARLRFLLKVHSVVLANLVLGENVFPELLQEECTAEKLAAELAQVMGETPVRARQLAALPRAAGKMRLDSGTPSGRAAEIVLRHLAAP